MRGIGNRNEQKMLLSKEFIYVVSKNPIILDNLPSEQFIQYHMDPHLRNIVDRWWKERFDTPISSPMTVQSMDMSKEMVKFGIGYTILPGICIGEEEGLYIKPLRYLSGKKVTRNTW